MNSKYRIRLKKAGGYALPLVLVAMLILIILSFGETMTSYTSRVQAVSVKAKTEAMLAAEAGYERAIFWMCQQSDILGSLQAGGGSGNINFTSSTCSYEVGFQGFLGSRPVFQVSSTGRSGRPIYTRIVDVNVMQETAGWAMAACRVPNASTSTSHTSTTPVSFVNGELINIPLHINKFNDISDDLIDISITGSPQFQKKVEMGESRKTSGGTDKYAGVMTCFDDGIDFDQPNVRITDGSAVQSKINRFRDSTSSAYKFTPPGRAAVGNTNPSDPCGAVQLQFYVDGNGTGKIRIFPSCTVRHYHRSSSYYTWDYNSVPDGSKFYKYDIYGYHYFDPNDGNNKTVNVTDTYVSQTFGGFTSEPGGQIYVNGNVIIGGDSNSVIDPTQKGQIVKGKITVVASGNIWIADPIYVDDAGGTLRDATSGMPTADNPNVLGLIAQGVVKVVDPGLSNYTGSGFTGGTTAATTYLLTSSNPGHTATAVGVPDSVYTNHKHFYQRIGIRKTGDANNVCSLPHDVVVEAAITVGGGGWGAENVATGSSGPNRKEYTTGTSDNLKVHGSITEVVRGVVGLPSENDGFIKQYTIDQRLMTGILPADIWFTGKYIPAPAGWHDYGIDN